MNSKFDVNSLIGYKKGKLTVIAYDHSEKLPSGNYKHIYKCECSCEDHNIVLLDKDSLLRKDKGATSCGCARTYTKTAKTKADGDSRSHFYHIWQLMKQKCDNANYSQYKEEYTYDPRWKDYMNFKQDMEDSYNQYVSDHGEKNVSLICSGNVYSASTCRWTTYDMHVTLHENSKYWYKNGLYTKKELYDNFCENIAYSTLVDRMAAAGYKSGDIIYDDSLFYSISSPIKIYPLGSPKLTEKMFFGE